MSFLKGAGKTIGFLALFIATGTAIGFAIKFYQMFDEMNYDFLLNMKFESIDGMNTLVKNLTLTPSQITKATSLIKTDGFFQLSELNLSDEQLQIVKRGADTLKDANQTLMSVFVVLSFIGVAGIVVGFFSMCCGTTNKSMISSNNDKIDTKDLNLSNFEFLNQQKINNPHIQVSASQ